MQTHQNKLLFVGAILLIIVDQITKYKAGELGLVSFNQGFLLESWPRLPFTIFFSFSAVFLVWLWMRSKKIFWPSAVTTAGVLSNLLDRGVFSSVRDWLPIPLLGGYNNLADWYICLGILWLLVLEYRTYCDKNSV